MGFVFAMQITEVTPPRAAASACMQILFISESRVAEVNVRINKTGSHSQSVREKYFLAVLCFQVFSDLADNPVLNPNIRLPFCPGSGVNNKAIFNDHKVPPVENDKI